MDKRTIVESLAQAKVVEHLIEQMSNRPMTPDLYDLSQMVYIILLEYDESKVIDLWEHDEIVFFISGILKRQWFNSKRSPYINLIKKFRNLSQDITTMGFTDE